MTDIEETEDGFVVQIGVPAVMTAADLTVECRDDRLWIRGEVSAHIDALSQEPHGHSYQHSQSHGSFQNSFTLPGPVDGEKAEATLADGLLTVRLPKAATTTHHRIPVTPA